MIPPEIRAANAGTRNRWPTTVPSLSGQQSLTVPLRPGQQSTPLAGPTVFFPVESYVIFPTLSYGPGSWSLIRLANPADSPKSLKVEVYRGNGERLPIDSMYTLKSGETIDIRLDGR